MNILSCVLSSPTVVSVPSTIKCLSLSDTIDMTDLVGAPLTTTALVIKAFASACIGFQEKVFPFLIVAIITSPKLSIDHEAGSITKLLDATGDPQVPLPHVPVPQP